MYLDTSPSYISFDFTYFKGRQTRGHKSDFYQLARRTITGQEGISWELIMATSCGSHKQDLSCLSSLEHLSQAAPWGSWPSLLPSLDNPYSLASITYEKSWLLLSTWQIPSLQVFHQMELPGHWLSHIHPLCTEIHSHMHSMWGLIAVVCYPAAVLPGKLNLSCLNFLIWKQGE